MKEKQFEYKIRHYLESKNVWYVKYFGCAYSSAGTPDLLCCANSYMLAIEVKSNTGKPTELQLQKIAQIRNSGGIAIVLCPEDLCQLMELIECIDMGDISSAYNIADRINMRWGINRH